MANISLNGSSYLQRCAWHLFLQHEPYQFRRPLSCAMLCNALHSKVLIALAALAAAGKWRQYALHQSAEGLVTQLHLCHITGIRYLGVLRNSLTNGLLPVLEVTSIMLTSIS